MPITKIGSLLLDTNVWLDYFMGEGPSLDEISGLIAGGQAGAATLLYAPTTAKDLFYLIPRRLRARGGGGSGDAATSYAPAAWACLDRMMEIAVAAPLSFPECELARMLRRKFPDFEDNLIIAAAEAGKADYIVTQDREFLRLAPEMCIAPARALELLEL